MLAGALALIVGLLVAEIVVGLAASSLALLADAGHMLTDAAALALALVAASFARRPPGGSWTFGFRRVEILAALANGITLALVGIRSEEHTSELQSQSNLVCRLLLEKKNH